MKNKNTWFYTILLIMIGIVFTKTTLCQTTNSVTAVPTWTCGYDLAEMNTLSSDTGIMNGIARYEAVISANQGNQTQSGPPYIVPVVFHIIETGGFPTVTYDQVKWQVARLNAAFLNQMYQFCGQTPGGRAVNTGIEFRLACQAQNSGNTWPNPSEPGVIHYYNSPSSITTQGVAPSTVTTIPLLALTNPTTVPTFQFSRYLNIWCVPNIVGSGSGIVVAYGTFPGGNFGGIDGIVMRLDAVGNNTYPTYFPLSPFWDQGSILAHEAGHYLGLYHTFETITGGNPNTAGGTLSCYGTTSLTATSDGDRVLDTPPCAIAGDLPGITTINTCMETNFPYGGASPDQPDQLENYMSYSDNSKLNTFTQGQTNRMLAAFTSTGSPRYTLNSASNFTFTGVVPYTCSVTTTMLTGIFNYSVAPGSNCNTVNIQFTNPLSVGFNTVGTTYSWNFGNGTGTGASPLHAYAVSGGTAYTVVCTATNGTNTASFTQTVNLNFGAKIVNQSGTKVCRGTEQTVFIEFQPGVPSALLTDGTNTVTVLNTKPSYTPTTMPYTFTATSNVSYSLVPVSCSGVSNGVATFEVFDCCQSLVTNGDFASTNSSSFFTQLKAAPSPTGTCDAGTYAYYGTYIIAAATATTFAPFNIISNTGNALRVDGFACYNTIINVPPACGSNSNTPIVWRQAVTGLQAGNDYIFSFKITDNYYTSTISNSCRLNFATNIITTSTTALSTQTFEPLFNPYSSPTSPNYFEVHTYTFTAPAGTTPTTSFSLSLYQINNFHGTGYDYAIDDFSLRQLTNSIQAVSNATICSGQSTVLTATASCGVNLANYNFAWTPTTGLSSTNTMSTTASPSITTVYTIVATPSSTVFGTSPFISSVTVTVKPTPTISVNSPTICIGATSSATLIASGATTYSWNTGATTSSIVVTPTVNTNYTITGSNNGCSSIKTVAVIVSQTPTVSVNSLTICSGGSYSLSASGATTYSWNTGATTSTLAVSPTSTTVYTVTGTTGGCSSIKTPTVTVLASPTITASANPTIICSGLTSTLTASGAGTYSWSTGGATTASISVSPTVTTIYTVTGTVGSGNNCSNTKTLSIVVNNSAPTVTLNASSVNVCSGNSTTLSAVGATNYTWTPNNVYTSTTVVTPSVITIYTVTGNYASSCPASTTTIMVNPVISTLCCSAATSSVGTSLTSSVNIASGNYTVSGTVIDMQGTITFTGNTSFSGYTFRMAANTLLKVAANQTLTLTNCKLFSCTELWNGIQLSSPDSYIGNLKLVNTTIEDMYNGIVLDHFGNDYNFTSSIGLIDIRGSVLNKNYISVQIKNSTGDSHNAPYPFGIITSTLSTNASTTSPGSSLKPSSTYTYDYTNIINGANGATAPYVNFPRAFKGIVLNNLGTKSPLIVGDSVTSSNTNTFDNLDFGIYGTEATAKVHNNYFKNITGYPKQNSESFLPTGPDEIGICVAMTHTSTVHQLTVGSYTILPSAAANAYPKGNVFENCNKGISAFSCKNVYAKANYFTGTTTSTIAVPGHGATNLPNTYYYYQNQNAIWTPAMSADETVSYNNINNWRAGIYTYGTMAVSTSSVYITDNTIKAPSSTGYCMQAIQVDQNGGANLNANNLYINHNNISNVYNGIAANGVLGGLNIYNNLASVDGVSKSYGYSATGFRTNIALNYCQYAYIKGNTVTSNTTAPTSTTAAQYLNGVYLTNSNLGKVECNTTSALGRDFVFEGTCDNTWLVNNMSNSYTGLEIRTNGVIGAQGATSGSVTPNLSANTWTNITQQTYVVSSPSVNVTSKLYLSAGATTQPTLNFASGGSATYTTGVNMGINPTTGTSYTCNSGSAQRLANGSNSNNGNGSSNYKMAGNTDDTLTEFTNLAIADANSYEVFPDEFVYQNQQFVYKLVDQNTIDPASGSSLDTFYIANQNTAINGLTKVQHAIANNDVTTAMSANAAVATANNVEYKHQHANDLVLKYLNDHRYQYTATEKQDLYDMANECLVKGYYVAQCRNILNSINGIVGIYNDNCEAEAMASRKGKTSAIITQSSSFLLYPNPNNGNMELYYDLVNENEATMKLFDVTGKLINTYKLQNTKGTIAINEQALHNGIYFYSILVKEKTIKTDKIVIIR